MSTTPDASAESRSAALLDIAGMGLSFACLLHCLALPLLLAVLPFAAASAFASEDFHKWMLLGVVPVSVLALGIGCYRRRAYGIAAFGLLGTGLISYAAFGHDLNGLSEAGETALTVTGALILSSSHLTNAHANGLLRLHWHRRGQAAHPGR